MSFKAEERQRRREVRANQRIHSIRGWVGEICSRTCRFRVFTSGDPKFYIFAALHPDYPSIETGLQIPVRKTDLKDDVRAILEAHSP